MTTIAKKWVVANWKMNPVTTTAVDDLLNSFNEKINQSKGVLPNLMLAPSFLHLAQVLHWQQQNQSSILLASQNVCGLNSSHGAFTGEVSAQQLKDLQINSVIIGHSERRQYFYENNDCLTAKIQCCLDAGLNVLLCVGETAEQYENQQTQQVIQQQLSILQPFSDKDLNNHLIIAYEPVWAIGTGKVPTVAEVTAVHEYILQILQSYNTTLVNTPVLYGGSVNAGNASEFSQSPVVSGVLVGGASLNAESFWQIIHAFSEK